MTSRIEGDFLKFNLYKVHRDWRFLPDDERQASKREFAAIIDELSNGDSLRTFSLVGTRADADLMIWQTSPCIEAFAETATRIASSSLGRYLERAYSYLAMKRRTPYKHGGGRPDAIKDDYRYFVLYPMVKKREWYQLPIEKRQEMMNDHFRVGKKYPSVKINTSYSFGLDDQEFVVGFETDELPDFVGLVMELREVAGGFYTERETPIFTATRMGIREALDALG